MSEGGLTDGKVYRDEDWPHGLRCADCDRLLREGDRYSERLTGFQGEHPLLLIVCAGCATTQTPRSGAEGYPLILRGPSPRDTGGRIDLDREELEAVTTLATVAALNPHADPKWERIRDKARAALSAMGGGGEHRDTGLEDGLSEEPRADRVSTSAPLSTGRADATTPQVLDVALLAEIDYLRDYAERQTEGQRRDHKGGRLEVAAAQGGAAIAARDTADRLDALLGGGGEQDES